jgi:hypothetical protein
LMMGDLARHVCTSSVNTWRVGLVHRPLALHDSMSHACVLQDGDRDAKQHRRNHDRRQPAICRSRSVHVRRATSPAAACFPWPEARLVSVCSQNRSLFHTERSEETG